MNILLILGIISVFLYIFIVLNSIDKFYRGRLLIESINDSFLNTFCGELLLTDEQDLIFRLDEYINLIKQIERLKYHSPSLVTFKKNFFDNEENSELLVKLHIKTIPCIICVNCNKNNKYDTYGIKEYLNKGVGD